MNAPLPTLRPPALHASLVRYQVLAALCVATTIAYIDRGCIQMVVEPIRADLELSKEDMGLAISAFFVAYALFQLPAGWLGHAWGTRRALPFFAGLWSAATAACALAGGFPGLLLARSAMGAAEAGIFPCAAASLGKWFPGTRRAWVSGVLGSFMGVGGALGTFLTGWLLLVLPWRWIFVVYALPGTVWAVWFFLWFRDRPQDHLAVNAGELDIIAGDEPLPAEKHHRAAAPTPWRAIFSSSTMWWINGQQFFRAAGYVFFMSWFPTYLEETRGLTFGEAGVLASLPHVAMLLGALAGGLIADWVLVRTGSRRLSRQGLAVASLLLCAVLTLGSYWVPARAEHAFADAVLAVVVISVGAFCASLAGPPAYAAAIDQGGAHVAPVFSTMNMSGNVGAVFFPFLAPRLVTWSGSWDLVLFVFAGLYLAAAACWLFLDPERPIIRAPAGREP
jgi:ACS family glucarate transporter-like MFS transporter